MTVIINITFPGILGVLCPSGMPCLPGFHPSFEDLHELWDLKLVTCIAPPGTSFCRVPPWVRGEPYCTADPQSSNPLHTKVCVYICALSSAPRNHDFVELPSLIFSLHSALLSWKSLTDPRKLLSDAHKPTQLPGWVLLLCLPRSPLSRCCRVCRKVTLQYLRNQSFPCPSPHHPFAQG